MDQPEWLFKPLQDWQLLVGKTDKELIDMLREVAPAVRISASMLSRAKRGLQPPRMELQLTLQKITGVTPAQWAEFYAEVVTDRSRPVTPKKTKNCVVEGAF